MFFPGMNLNVRVKGQHVDFEEKTYYASFSGELEASASPMWALVTFFFLILSSALQMSSESLKKK